jgi:hypothetical protein
MSMQNEASSIDSASTRKVSFFEWKLDVKTFFVMQKFCRRKYFEEYVSWGIAQFPAAVSQDTKRNHRDSELSLPECCTWLRIS